jgi:hypothetical protein
LTQNYRYLEKQQKIKELRDLEEFNRGVALAKYCMQNEKYYMSQLNKKFKEKEHQDLKKKVEDKKRQIHQFFESTRAAGNLPKDIVEL